MAINAQGLELLLKLARQSAGPKRLICLGYPDLLLTDAQIDRLCGSDIRNRTVGREDP